MTNEERDEIVKAFEEMATNFAYGDHGVDEEWLKIKMKAFATAWVLWLDEYRKRKGLK